MAAVHSDRRKLPGPEKRGGGHWPREPGFRGFRAVSEGAHSPPKLQVFDSGDHRRAIRPHSDQRVLHPGISAAPPAPARPAMNRALRPTLRHRAEVEAPTIRWA